MFICLLPLISIIVLLLADICVLNIGKFKLEKALDAGCEWAEHEYRMGHSELDENIIKQVCIENLPTLKQLSINKIKETNGLKDKVYVEISACVDIPTSILMNEGRKIISISSKRKKAVLIGK